MAKRNYAIVRAIILLTLFLSTGSISCVLSHADQLPEPGNRYKIIEPLYLMAVYDNSGNKELSRDTARAYLHPERYAEKHYVAFQRKVPVGTIMTIIRPEPKVLPLPFFAHRYIVRLDPDISRGLEVELALNRGMEGNLDGRWSESGII